MTYAQGFALGANKKAQRDALNEQKRALDAELMLKGYKPDGSIISNSAADVQTKTNQALVQSLNALQGKLAAQESDQGIIDFATTGDASYLQNTLNNNPLLAKTWRSHGVHGVANLDFENDKNLLAQHGLSDSHYDTPDKQAVLRKNLYKVYDGKNWRLGELQNVSQTTGLLDRVGLKRGGAVLDNHEEMVKMLQGPKVSPYTAEGHKYEFQINNAAEQTGLPPNLIASMIAKEARGGASGNPDPKSLGPMTKYGWRAGGLMQLSPAVAAKYGVTDVNDPEQNIRGGAMYMRDLLKQYGGNLDHALAAYNAGPGVVNKYKGIPPYHETQDYVKTIKANYTRGEMYYNADQMTATPDALLQNRVEKLQQQFGPVEDGQPASDYFTTDDDSRVGTEIPDDAGMVKQLDKNQRVTRRADARIKTINDFFTDQNVATGKTKLADTSEKRTADEKNLEQAARLRQQMFDAFGGEDNFYKTDMSDTKNFNKAYNYAVQINKLQGTKFDAADKKTIMEVRGLIALGDPAATLTDAQTGMFDATFADIKKNFSDNVAGVEGRAAYETFRNIIRHSLAGSALTEQEIKYNDRALGPATQKRGAVLTQLKVALGQVKAKLDSVATLSDPSTSKVLLGASQDKMNAILAGLQQRIDAISNPEGAIAGLKGTSAPAERPSLDAIFQK